MAQSIFFYTDSRELGGAEQALLMLLETLDRSRWAPTLLLDADDGAEPLAEEAARLGVSVMRIDPMPLGLSGAGRVPSLVRLLRRERPALFHAHLSWPLAAKWGLAAAVLARLPGTLATVQLIPRMTLERSSRVQLQLLAAAVDRYIAVSEAIAAELSDRFRWPAAKIDVVYNAVSLDRFDAAGSERLRAELTGGRDAPLVLTCARLDRQKGHPVLLNAATALPEARFVLAGEGPLRTELEAEATALGVRDRVVFLGRRTDVPALLAACDIFALPSLYEGSSLAVLEAMAARRAVVSSAIAGTDELIADGTTGLLVPPGDPNALAKALRRLLEDGELRDALATQARERVERDFTRAAMAARTEAIYEEVLAGGRRAD